MPRRVVLLSTSPRVAPGLLAEPAWRVLRDGAVCCGKPNHPQLPALAAAGIAVDVLPAVGAAARAARLDELASDRPAVWLCTDDAPALARALAQLPAVADGELEVELLLASWDLPGGRLIDVVTTMDRLRSPGGCPWDAEQTHASLAKYLLEEAYETLEAIEDDDLGALREELGDLLLQVVFHARLAEEASAAERWSIDDVAADLVAKLVRRHPHVFGDVEVAGAGEVAANWESIKAAEKGRRSVAEGVPLGQPALALASALVSRAARNGIAVAELLPAAVGSSPEAAVAAAAEHAADSDEPVEAVGELLLRVVLLAAVLDVDPEAALRGAARRLRERLLRVPGEAAGSEVEGPAVVGPDTFPAARVVPDRRLAPGAPSDAPTAGALDSAPSIGERRLADVIDPAAPPRDDGGLTGPNTEVPEFPG